MDTGLELEAKRTRREESETVDIIYKSLHSRGASRPQNTSGWGRPTATRPGGIKKRSRGHLWAPAAPPWKPAWAKARERHAERGCARTRSGAPGTRRLIRAEGRKPPPLWSLITDLPGPLMGRGQHWEWTPNSLGRNNTSGGKIRSREELRRTKPKQKQKQKQTNLR